MRHWKGWDAVKPLNQSKYATSWCETKGPGAEIVTTHGSIARVWSLLWMKMNSNLVLAKPFIILMVREWKGWDAVICSNKSKLTQSWCEKWTRAKPTLTPPVTETHVVVTILEPTHQSHHSPTFQYTYDETLEGLRCSETLESIRKHSILVWNVGYWSQIVTTYDSKAIRLWLWLHMIKSYLNLAKPFIILMVR